MWHGPGLMPWFMNAMTALTFIGFIVGFRRLFALAVMLAGALGAIFYGLFRLLRWAFRLSRRPPENRGAP